MRLRTVLVALAATLASTFVPGTADAAVPTKFTPGIWQCSSGKGVARVWWTVSHGRYTKLAVDNGCADEYVALSDGGYYIGQAKARLLVAPGKHFNWGQNEIKRYTPVFDHVSLKQDAGCEGPTTIRVVSRYDKVRTVC
jgi:hypothetical protein